MWAVGPARYVAADAAPRNETNLYSRTRGGVRLFGAINETVACQVVLTASGAPVVDARVVIGDFVSGASRIDASHVQVLVPHDVPVAPVSPRARLYAGQSAQFDAVPDVLLPLANLTVPAGGSVALWVEVAVPFGTTPGLYRSTLAVTAGGWSVSSISIELKVWPFALPTESHLPVMAALDVEAMTRAYRRSGATAAGPGGDRPARDRAMADVVPAMRELHRHRSGAYLPHFGPVVRRDREGQPVVDWSSYDALVTGILDGTAFGDGTAMSIWPLPVSVEFPPPERYGGVDAAAYWRFLGAYVAECVRHFEQHGWLDRSVAWYDMPTDDPQAYRQLRRFAAVLADVDPRPRLAASAMPESMVAYGWPGCYYEDMADVVDTWAPPGRYFHPQQLAEYRRAGKQAWLQADKLPFTGSTALTAPAMAVRALAWQAYRVGADALLLDGQEAATGLVGFGPDSLLWSGTPFGLAQPVASRRLKHLRRGLLDYEYLWLLRRHGRTEIADQIARCLIRAVGTDAYVDNHLDGRIDAFERDPDIWELARQVMGYELARAIQPEGSQMPEPLAQRLRWQRLLSATRQIRLSVDGARVQADVDESGGWEVRLATTVSNGLFEPIEGEVRWETLPDGWDAAAQQPIALEPDATQRVTLVSQADGLAADAHGHMPVTIACDAGMAGLATAEARLSIVTVPWATSPIVVDGDPSDWPLGRHNAAGQFVLFDGITPASQPTIAMMLRDQRYLYMLVHCFDDRMAAVATDRSNVVSYDGLIPTDHELVEVLFDPGATATGSSDDLYHLVVKRNGVVIAERGVGVTPPVGRHAPWPVQVHAVVRDMAARWVVELAIPLSGFSGSDRPLPVWGFNVARMHGRLGEYASWSGARRHMYNTLSLGNLVWLPPAPAASDGSDDQGGF